MPPSCTISFTYNPDKYPALHEWLSGISHDRSHHIREMLERGLQGSPDTLLEQILAEVQAIRSQGVFMEPRPMVGDGDLPADILANLGSLGE